MNAVGIDVSKGKSMVTIVRPFGRVILAPLEVSHTVNDLAELTHRLRNLEGDTRVVMEHTGKYYLPIATVLHEAGIFVSVVNPLLIHDYGNNSIRQVKTDKKDALKIASYALDRWNELKQFSPVDNNRQMLITYNRQYNQYVKFKVILKNNLTSLMDQAFPGVNTLFPGVPRLNGHEKWIDFAAKYWHCDCVCRWTQAVFAKSYRKWCHDNGYRFKASKAIAIYEKAHEHAGLLPQSAELKLLVGQAVKQLNHVLETLSTLLRNMREMAASTPEYPIVMAMRGVGEVLGPQLIAEIGDIRRFANKRSLVAFAGIDAPPYQSGKFTSHSRGISKRGSPSLRKTLFMVMSSILRTGPSDDSVNMFIDKKREEGKHLYVCMMAGANKFLRIYFARVSEFLHSLNVAE